MVKNVCFTVMCFSSLLDIPISQPSNIRHFQFSSRNKNISHLGTNYSHLQPCKPSIFQTVTISSNRIHILKKQKLPYWIPNICLMIRKLNIEAKNGLSLHECNKFWGYASILSLLSMFCLSIINVSV